MLPCARTKDINWGYFKKIKEIPNYFTFTKIYSKKMASGGDNNSCYAYRYTWDVFLSFRGEDTRRGFTSNLYKELRDQGVRTFRDDEGMKHGDEIAPTLLAAIEESAAAIVVISENYADSKWCLEELTKIVDCKRLIFPVFYKVDPLDVQSQSKSFAVGFQKHEGKVAAEKVDRWRNAMHRVANTSERWDSWKWEESELINDLVKKILKKLNNIPTGVAEYLVGVDTRLENLLQKLDVKTSGVRVIGLYGMGGIGKTTLAKALYNKLIVHFRRRSFVSSVQEESRKKNGLEQLQEKVGASLSSKAPPTIYDAKRGINDIEEAGDDDAILLVLDDVDSSNQIDVLAGRRDWFHGGSRIIITSRHKEVFPNNVMDEICEVQTLSFPESLQLFSYHAFGRDKPTERFLEVPGKIVELAGGLPLVLEVFGSFLFYKRTVREWHDALEKLQNVCARPHQLQDLLEISYTSLDEQEQRIFLDIACFFVDMRMKREDAIDIFRGCGFSAETAITDLTAKSLIKIVDENVLWMHDELRDMGRGIVRREPGDHNRLWGRDEILKVLKNEKGTGRIEGITLDFVKEQNINSGKPYPIESQNRSQFAFDNLKMIYNRWVSHKEELDDETLCTKAFQPMVNLRLLQINNAKLDGNFKFLPAGLNWLQWKGCPLKCLPFEFQPQDLAVLDLSESKITQLWSQRWWDDHGKKMGKKLLVIKLYACRNLLEIPDLSGLCIEKLILEKCSALVKIHASVGDMSKLTYLNLRECNSLQEFPSDVSGLKCLQKLDLSGCSSLTKLPEDMNSLKSLRELLADRTAIAKLPDFIFLLKNLEILNLNDCLNLAMLPNSIGSLRSLRELSLNGSALKELPPSLRNLSNLEQLSLERCLSLTLLPETIGDLKSLTALYLQHSSIYKLPQSIGSLSHLKFLSMNCCENSSHLQIL